MPCETPSLFTLGEGSLALCNYEDGNFARLPASIPHGSDTSSANEIVNDIIPTFIKTQLAPGFLSTRLQGTQTEYDSIGDWAEYTMSLREKRCESRQMGPLWEYSYEFQIKFVDPMSPSAESIMILGGYAGKAYEDVDGTVYAADGIVRCVPPTSPHSAIETDASHISPPQAQFAVNQTCVDSTFTDPPLFACVDCAPVVHKQSNNAHVFSINSPTACDLNAYGTVMRHCIMPDSCTPTDLNQTTLSIQAGVDLYVGFILQTHPFHNITWYSFDILHVFTNSNSTGKTTWTFWTMLVREDAWGVTLFEEAVEFRFLAGNWALTFKSERETPSTTIAPGLADDQACTMNLPTYSWPEPCDPSRTCTNRTTVYPVYRISQYGVNGGEQCSREFTTPPEQCPPDVDCYIVWPAFDLERIQADPTDYSSSTNVGLLSFMGIVCVATIAGVIVKLITNK